MVLFVARRRKASKAARGLGWRHEQQRRLLPDPAGAPCPYCGEPMVAGQPLDADHAYARALGGAGGPLRWAHASCNRSAGAILGNALRGVDMRVPWADRWV